MNTAHFAHYAARLRGILAEADWRPVEALAEDFLGCWKAGRQVFLCGNGGSAGNASHLANDMLYGVSKIPGKGLRVTSLAANESVMTCLANDLGYENIFATQLAVLGRRGDLLVAFSGSGNSPNILRALEKARQLGVKSYAVLGYSGGKAKALADVPIHFAVDDMQLSEDLQLVVGHMIMQYLYARHEEVPHDRA